MNKYGEAIIAKKKVELTAEQLKELEEQQKAFIIDPKQKPLFPDPMTEKQVNKLLAYAIKCSRCTKMLIYTGHFSD